MNKSTWFALCFVPLLGLAACVDAPLTPAPGAGPSLAQGASDTPGSYVVVFRSASGIPSGFAADVEALGGVVDYEMAQVGAALVSNLAGSEVRQLARGRQIQSIDRDVPLPMNTVRTALESAEVSRVVADLESPLEPQTAGFFFLQWNMTAIDAVPAWSAGFLGSPDVTAAVLDTGIDEGSETVPAQSNIDLLFRVDRERSRSFMPDEDAVVENLFGPGAPLYTDLDGHGTNVASQISSGAFNLAGVTSQTTLMAVKVCSILPPPPTPANPNPAPGFCSTAAIFAGFHYAIDQGADVINLSLGADFRKSQIPGFVAVINRLLQYANSNRVTVVTSAGNTSTDLDHDRDAFNIFCNASTVICVSATGPTDSGPGFEGPFENPDAPAIFSNFGRSAIDVAAPGGNAVVSGAGLVGTAFVWSLCPRSTAAVYVPATGTVVPVGPCTLFGFAGTSQASPHVAGLAAMLVSIHGRNPGLTRAKIRNSADQLGASGNDPRYGRGRINVARAVGL